MPNSDMEGAGLLLPEGEVDHMNVVVGVGDSDATSGDGDAVALLVVAVPEDSNLVELDGDRVGDAKVKFSVGSGATNRKEAGWDP